MTIKNERITPDACTTAISVAKCCSSYARQQNLSLRHIDLYQNRVVCAFCLAAVGKFLFHADGIGGSEHIAAEVERPGVFQLADGADSDYRSGHSEYDRLPVCQL